jgi:ubiquinone/menaquinone biosynthesis C-methylase UbiE
VDERERYGADIIGGDMSRAWRGLERDPGEVTRYLELVTQLLDVMKRKSIDMLRLQPGGSALDVGCGLGRDAELILGAVGSAGRVVGIDPNQDLVAKAIERTRAMFPQPEFRVGDALALEFADDTFDACRTDRVLQHLHDPARAVVEMVRVTRPGGRASVIDVDWHTLTIAGGDIAVAQEVARHQAFVASSQGDIGRRLVQLLMDAGCEDVEVDAEVAFFRDLGTANFVLQIRRTLEAGISSGAIARNAGEVWWKAVRELDVRDRFFASINVVICTGTVS